MYTYFCHWFINMLIKKTYRKEALNRFDYDVVHLFTLKILIALIPQEKKKPCQPSGYRLAFLHGKSSPTLTRQGM